MKIKFKILKLKFENGVLKIIWKLKFGKLNLKFWKLNLKIGILGNYLKKIEILKLGILKNYLKIEFENRYFKKLFENRSFKN